MKSGVPTRRSSSPDEELEQATADYLRVSRGAGDFPGPDEHMRAEEEAWERLLRAREAVERESRPS